MDEREEIFVKLMGSLDYPLFIVTTTVGTQREGAIIGFATQTSIQPGRFLACLSRSNRTYRVARKASALVVHFVPRHRRDLAELFGGETGDEVDKFARCEWFAGPRGLPVLSGCPSWFIGAVVSHHDLGDHMGFGLDPIESRFEPGELLYFQDLKDVEPGHPA